MPTRTPLPPPPPDATLEERHHAYLRALLAHDAVGAREVAHTALDVGVTVSDVYLAVLQPAMFDVGERWAAGEVTVADEHFATATTLSVMGGVRARLRVPPRDGRLAIVSCTPGEQHALGAQMVADLLESDGWEALVLGAATPPDALADMVDGEQPDLLVLSTSTAGRLPGVAEALAAVRALETPPVIVVGGQLCTEMAADELKGLGADHVERDALELVSWLRERFPPQPELDA